MKLKIMKTTTKKNCLENLLGATRNLTTVCTELGKLDEALIYNLEAYVLIDKSESDTVLKAEAIWKVGQTYLQLHNYQEALMVSKS